MTDTNNIAIGKSACIVGAGTAGLCALKHCLENGIKAICYEQSRQVGGTWVYKEHIGNAELEDEIQSSMYEGLRTNLPKEIMGFPDFGFDDKNKISFVTSDKVLEFLENYAKHFELENHIQFENEVIRVRPRSYAMHDKSFWEVYVKDLKTEKYTDNFFDFIFVCNGHHTVPAYPEFEGLELYNGKKLHSHLYRKASNYKDETILIIGAGPSGMDLAFQLNDHAKHVFLSHHLKIVPRTDCLKNVTQKCDLEKFTEDGAIFKDGTTEQFSMILFCTGYCYSFPFLSVDCKINAAENFVTPLYKHVINVYYPTMAMIGLNFKVCPTHLIDLQVRFAMKYFLKELQLPSTKQMLDELQAELETRRARGLPPRRFHEMGDLQFDYYDDLAKTAEIEPIKPVICNIMKDCKYRYIFELDTYRNNYFKLLDDEKFVKYKSSA